MERRGATVWAVAPFVHQVALSHENVNFILCQRIAGLDRRLERVFGPSLTFEQIGLAALGRERADRLLSS